MTSRHMVNDRGSDYSYTGTGLKLTLESPHPRTRRPGVIETFRKMKRGCLEELRAIINGNRSDGTSYLGNTSRRVCERLVSAVHLY